MRRADLVYHIICGKFFTKTFLFKQHLLGQDSEAWFGQDRLRWADLVYHIICGKFFTKATSFKPETCEAVKAVPDDSFRAVHREQASYSDSQLCATVCWRFGLVIKLNYCSDFEHFGQDFKVEVEARFWSWSLVSILLLMFGWGYEVESWISKYSAGRFGQDSNFRFLSRCWCLVEILKLMLRFWNCDMFEICELWSCDMNPRVRCAFGNVLCVLMFIFFSPGWKPCTAMTKMRMMIVTMSGTRLQAFDQLQLEE